jgi:hypothetical protein
MSAFGGKADMVRTSRNVCPEADITRDIDLSLKSREGRFRIMTGGIIRSGTK